MSKRPFIVLHTGGAEFVNARGVAEALQKCHLPGGFRSALAVIDAAFTAGVQNFTPRQLASPFLAFIGTPAFAAKP